MTTHSPPLESPFAGRVAIVTGSTRGIGRAVAERIAAGGAAVAINFPDAQEAQIGAEVCENIRISGGRAIAIQEDVRNPIAVQRLFEDVETAFGGVDFVISNVGGSVRLCALAEFDEALFEQVIGLNLKSAFLVLRESARRVRPGGRIVAISTSTTRRPYPGTAAYAAAKAGVELLTQVLARELGHKHITCNSVSPGLTLTDAVRDAGVPRERLDAVLAQTPLGRLGTPADIASAVTLLLRDEAGWITGQHVNAGGGAFA